MFKITPFEIHTNFNVTIRFLISDVIFVISFKVLCVSWYLDLAPFYQTLKIIIGKYLCDDHDPFLGITPTTRAARVNTG